MTLLCNINFRLIMIQILMKNLGIRTFLIVSIRVIIIKKFEIFWCHIINLFETDGGLSVVELFRGPL